MARRIKVEAQQTAEDEEIDMAIAQLDENDEDVFGVNESIAGGKMPTRAEVMQAAAVGAAKLSDEEPPLPKRQAPSARVFGETLSTEDASSPEVVEVTWGQELFSPVKYTTITVGPFSAKGEVLRGETAEQAYERLYARVRAFAERERERKLTSFIAAAKTAMQNG